jgi:hypothetical protein
MDFCLLPPHIRNSMPWLNYRGSQAASGHEAENPPAALAQNVTEGP